MDTTVTNKKDITMNPLNNVRGLVSIAALFAAAAALSGEQTPKALVSPGPPVTAGDVARIRIGPGDLINVGVYDEPTLLQTIRVDDLGNADLLLIGRQHLAGLSTSEAGVLIQKLFKQDEFLLNPQVTLLISEYNTQGVSVLGEVKKPGNYPVLGDRNLLDVLSLAGGPTPLAANVVTIQRRSGSQETVKTALTNDPDQLLASRVAIQPGDTIVVPKAGVVYVLGEVGRPGAFVIQSDGAMSLAQAVAWAAGVNFDAAQARTRIIRKTHDGFEEQTVNLKRVLEGKDPDPGLKPEDIVYIPASAIKSILARASSVAQSAASAAVYSGVVAIP
jgi:polysaccharide export outer membrane protein